MRLHFRSFGTTGDPLILLHGLFGSLENWHSVSLKLSEQFRVLAVDQRNHGHSPHSPEMNYSLMAQDLAELMEDQRLERAHVLGHSMGAKTAMQFALLHPEKVRKLIPVDLAPRAYSGRHERIFSALLALDLSAFATRQQIETALAPSIPDLALRRFLLKNVSRTQADGFEWKIGLPEIHANYPQLGAQLSLGRPFAGPVLFLRGEKSDYLGEQDLPLIRTLFPQARLQTIPEAGHLVHVENPQGFLRAVLDFLGGAES